MTLPNHPSHRPPSEPADDHIPEAAHLFDSKPPPTNYNGVAHLLLPFMVLVVLGGIAYGIGSSVYSDMQVRLAQRQHGIEAPAYDTLYGDELQGSGFHFTFGDATYIATSLHQFEGKIPTAMMSLDVDQPITILSQVYKQEDVQILAFESPALLKIAPLRYESAVIVSKGTPVYIYSDEGVIHAHITSLSETTGIIALRTKEPFAAQGQSGSPIVSAKTGTVIAVLLGANDIERATRVEAELLKLPARLHN
jgi:hypothetical protein